MADRPGETTITTERYNKYRAYECGYRNLKERLLEEPGVHADVLHKIDELEKEFNIPR